MRAIFLLLPVAVLGVYAAFARSSSAPAGLVLPMATGIVPWLTPLAAVGLAAIVLIQMTYKVMVQVNIKGSRHATSFFLHLPIGAALARF